MGGRRTRSITELVGTGLGTQRGQLTRAIHSENAATVAASSARLVAISGRTADILYYASKIAGFVAKVVKSGKPLSYPEREALARGEWSRIKKKEKLKDDSVLTTAIVSATTKALGKGSK